MPARARGSMSVSNTSNSTPTRSNHNFTRSELSLASLTNELVYVGCCVHDDGGWNAGISVNFLIQSKERKASLKEWERRGNGR